MLARRRDQWRTAGPRHTAALRQRDCELGPSMSNASATTIYVPRDSSAVSLGAGAVAEAIATEAARRKAEINLIRNGSRGLYWLEPLVEVATARGRIAYGPISGADVTALFDAGFLDGGEHPLGLGPTDNIAYLKRQSRVTFARVGITDPVSLDDYIAHGGYRGLTRQLAISMPDIVQQ